MSKLDDIKSKVKVEALVGLLVLVVIFAGGILFLGGSAINDTQVAPILPSIPIADNSTQDQGISDQSGYAGYYALPGTYYTYGASNQNYQDLDQYEVPEKETEQSETITPENQNDEDNLSEISEEEDLDPEDILLPGDDGFPDDLFPEENPDSSNNTTNDTSQNNNTSPSDDTQSGDDVGDYDAPDPVADDSDFPEEVPEDIPNDDWINDWIND